MITKKLKWETQRGEKVKEIRRSIDWLGQTKRSVTNEANLFHLWSMFQKQLIYPTIQLLFE